MKQMHSVGMKNMVAQLPAPTSNLPNCSKTMQKTCMYENGIDLSKLNLDDTNKIEIETQPEDLDSDIHKGAEYPANRDDDSCKSFQTDVSAATILPNLDQQTTAHLEDEDLQDTTPVLGSGTSAGVPEASAQVGK